MSLPCFLYLVISIYIIYFFVCFKNGEVFFLFWRCVILLNMGKIEAKLKNKAGSGRDNKYSTSEIELKWQSKWAKEGTYQPDMVNAKRPFFNLMMFPYPSAEGLHVGSVFTFSGVDVYGRFKRMQGNDVFEPIGLDGFGIHSENHAIKTGTHPIEHAKSTEKNFYRQLREIGNGFDWRAKVETYDPHYYRWTQWLFIELFKLGLAYRKKAEVNWCPSCKTVLADEQVIEAKCERCGSEVERRDLEQWFFRITKYAERLLKNIEDLDWTEKVKVAQKNWIGKSQGACIEFQIKDSDLKIEVFTTRPDTLFGATFLAVSVRHAFVAGIKSKEVVDFVSEAKVNSEREIGAQEKIGVFSGFYAVNPVNGESIPVWIVNYVLIGYGTGAIMAVPAHDSRDYEFAVKYKLPIKFVINGVTSDNDKEGEAYTGGGLVINSGEWNGWRAFQDIDKVIDWLDKRRMGESKTEYHLRDWLISRQRYWGPPIPMIFCEECAKDGKSWFTRNKRHDNGDWDAAGWYPVEEKGLPVELPYVEDYKPLGTGKSPLANYPDFYETKCPECGGSARRETDVSDTFLDSAWYFFRYVSADRNDVAFDKEIVRKWLPVTMYIGGAEHSVLHLLYSRFITMVLKDAGHIDFEEPFARFYSHGLIVKDGAKMSKSKGNVINPDEYKVKFGVDTLRMYLHFLGPFNEGGDFRDTGIEGMHRFLKRVWRLFEVSKLVDKSVDEPAFAQSYGGRRRMMHQTIQGVTEDLENLRYNRAIAKLMTWYNFLAKQDGLSMEEAEAYLKLLAPFAPHMTEELWQRIRGKGETGSFGSIHLSEWPSFDPKYLEEESVIVAVQVNGKMRDTISIKYQVLSVKNRVEEIARESEKVQKYLEGKKIKKIIYVPGKVINFVVYG